MGSGEGKSRKRRSSASSGEEEERERKKRRDKKESRRSSRGSDEEEEKRRRKKKHGHRGKDKERDSKEKRSKEKEKSKRKDKDPDFKEISKDDYFAKSNEFATWLKEEKGKYFSDLSSESARDIFLKFVKQWNKGKLPSQYYEGITTGPRSAHNWNIKAAIAYIPTVVRELREQLRRLRDEAGMRRVVVTNLHPMGCTSVFTRPLNYTGCDPLANAGAAQHNAALESVLATLDPANTTFLLLDVHTPFAAILLDDASSKFVSPLRPCCESFTLDGYCGEQDENGTRQYSLCDDPRRHFFWDDVHPTQAAWAAVAGTFRATVKSFLST